MLLVRFRFTSMFTILLLLLIVIRIGSALVSTTRMYKYVIVVAVHGFEYLFGAHIYPSTGIFEEDPKRCKRFKLRKTILIGWTELEAEEVKKVMKEFSKEYKGNAYNLITKNCNHFSNDVCKKLTGNHIPTWVNRLARIGMVFNCVIPASITTTRIQQQQTRRKEKRAKGRIKQTRK
ncbi:deSI-like protein At4g17486 isoform X2 [Chenopodium quinoa]|uniref:deSI-like protein At4g17486 isoform X2 n=1 Tax=Chenopodium quinoa TaxID=63459 RepID=UPI000B7892A4|nr:deSI-like protein At4g17486 isoform X2 [Chenopodium quinoa]